MTPPFRIPQPMLVLLFVLVCLPTLRVQAQDPAFYFGADLSYANQMEDCGAVFKEDGAPKDVYRIFADHGTTLVRVRLWVDPTWQHTLTQPPGVKPQYSDLADVKETIARARTAGMAVMLGLHYSDFWTDPGRQVIPARWRGVADTLDVLADSVYQYTRRVLLDLDDEGLMPDIVKIGNEHNGGLLVHRTMDANFAPEGVVSQEWARHAVLFNAAIGAVREVGATAAVNPQIALHFAGLDGLQDRYQTLLRNGVTDFDIMGFSYYYAWHRATIAALERAVRDLKTRFPGYDVMPVETGYPWSPLNFDALPNIITTPSPAYLPLIPEKQLEYMVDYARAVMRAGGAGVVFWEPAWVSTPCRTPWGQGSSQEHVAFFDPEDTNFIQHGGGHWAEPRFYTDPQAHKVTFRVDMTGQDVSGGVYIAGPFTDGAAPAPMAHLGGGLYSYFTYLPAGAEGGYYFLNGTTREIVPAACARSGGTDRPYTVPSEDLILTRAWGACGTPATGPVEATFAVDMAGQDVSRGVYITGHVTDWAIVPMTVREADVYVYTTHMQPGAAGAYYYLTTPTWDNYLAYREAVPAACATWYGSDRGYEVPGASVTYAVRWGTCEPFAVPTAVAQEGVPQGLILEHGPNPIRHTSTVAYEVPRPMHVTLALYDLLGRRVLTLVDAPHPAGRRTVTLAAGALPAGVYLLRIHTPAGAKTRKIVRVQ